jgi:hypothetical protein
MKTMKTSTKISLKTLYDTDYNQWIETTVKQLQESNFKEVDWENLIEEVADLSRRERQKFRKLLTRLWEHLLKLGYWESERERNAPHWKKEVRNFRKQIKQLLKDSPSLKPFVREIFEECYQDAREMVADLSELHLDIFPANSIANYSQILDENWLPK